MIFGYSIPEAKKTVISAVVFILSAVALFVAFDPGIKEAIIVLVGNGFAVVAVFSAPKFSVDDLTKMLGQLVGSVQSLLTFFVVINPNVWVVVGSVISLIPIGYAVWKAKNLEPINMEVPPPAGATLLAQGLAPPGTLSPVASPRADLPVDAPAPPPPGPPDPPVPPASRPVE
jgi:hypothetical protein